MFIRVLYCGSKFFDTEEITNSKRIEKIISELKRELDQEYFEIKVIEKTIIENEIK